MNILYWSHTTYLLAFWNSSLLSCLIRTKSSFLLGHLWHIMGHFAVYVEVTVWNLFVASSRSMESFISKRFQSESNTWSVWQAYEFVYRGHWYGIPFIIVIYIKLKLFKEKCFDYSIFLNQFGVSQSHFFPISYNYISCALFYKNNNFYVPRLDTNILLWKSSNKPYFPEHLQIECAITSLF